MLELLQSIITPTTKHALYIETRKVHEWSTSKLRSYGISDQWYIMLKEIHSAFRLPVRPQLYQAVVAILLRSVILLHPTIRNLRRDQ